MAALTVTSNYSACESYTLPNHLHDHVELILPSVHFDARVRRRSDDTRDPSVVHQIGQPSSGTGPKTTGTVWSIFGNLAACDEQITPDCLRALYNIVYKPLETNKNSFAVGKSAVLNERYHGSYFRADSNVMT